MTVSLLPAGFVGSCCWNGRSIPQAEWSAVEWSGAIAIVSYVVVVALVARGLITLWLHDIMEHGGTPYQVLKHYQRRLSYTWHSVSGYVEP
jgi:hypothetical protein